MRTVAKSMLFFILVLVAGQVHAADKAISKWVSLDADSKKRLMRIVQSEVQGREGFSTSREDRLNTQTVEAEKQKEMSAYKAAINAANSKFVRTKKRRDDLMTQFQTAAYDFEELEKSRDNIQTSVDNIDNQIARYRHDISAQRKSLSAWLKTEKQGEAIVAVIYTRGFKDSAHKLESRADQISAPLMARHMGTYIKSFTKVINNMLTTDFIRTIEEGTAEWNREEPLRIVLKKGVGGTTYLRIKRYELYPFQAPKPGSGRPGKASSNKRVRVIGSRPDLDTFLAANGYEAGKIDLGRVETMLRETTLANRQAKEGLREQLTSFRERINYLEKKIKTAKADRGFQVSRLGQKKLQVDKSHTELEMLRLKKDSAAMAFQDAQGALYEKKRVHESIIVKSSLVTAKRSQSPAEASAEAVLEELEEVLNDAKLQHSSSTTDVENFQIVGEASTQTVTEAKIVAVRLLSFINEGDSVRVKMAFRVRTVLDEKTEPAPAVAKKAIRPAAVTPVTKKKPVRKKTSAVARKKKPAAARKKKPTPPKVSSLAIAEVKLADVHFKLNRVLAAGSKITFFVAATNKAPYTQYIALYDKTVGYTLSSMTDASGDVLTVDQVNLWQGKIKTRAADSRRGVAVEPGQFVIAELTFENITPGLKRVSEFKLHPYVGTRSFIGRYSWYAEYLLFENVRVKK